jgi:DNA-binding CsgD family transcriptional regulator
VAIRGNRIHRQGRPRSKEGGAGGRAILTAREIDVLSLLARDYSYAEIATRLGISLNTVASHIKNSYRKLAVHSGAAAVTRAAELGLLRRGDDKGPGL